MTPAAPQGPRSTLILPNSSVLVFRGGTPARMTRRGARGTGRHDRSTTRPVNLTPERAATSSLDSLRSPGNVVGRRRRGVGGIAVVDAASAWREDGDPSAEVGTVD